MVLINTVIEAQKVNKIYTKRNESVHAVNNADIKLDVGKFYSIMGHSGSGKTSLLQILGLLDNMTSGNLYINHLDVSKMTERDKAKIRMEVVGFVFQSCFLNPKLKAFENVMLPMYVNKSIKSNEMKIKSMELLDLLGLKERASHFPKELSGGEQQRVAIARALANNPSFIFADEPTGNLDTENELIVFDFLKKLSQRGKCVLVVSHDEIVKEYSDELYLMDKGSLVKQLRCK